MATAANVISSARYDLRDTDSNQYTDDELLDYLNRAVFQLDNALSQLGSDWVLTEDSSTTLSAASNSVSAPSDCIKIREIWIGDDQLVKTDARTIYYKRKFISATGQPYYFAHNGTSVIFEYTADDNYSLKIYYDARSSTLSIGDSMPYNSEFNQPLREMTVMLAKRRQEYDITIDSSMFNFFMDAVISTIPSRNVPQRIYKMGF